MLSRIILRVVAQCDICRSGPHARPFEPLCRKRGEFNGVSINRSLRKARVDLMSDLSINKVQGKQTRLCRGRGRPKTRAAGRRSRSVPPHY